MNKADTILNQCRLLLAHIRNGDFSHAGGEEAIDIVMQDLKMFNSDWRVNNAAKKVLDAGSGLGGTADQISKKLACEVWGIDIDEAAISYAQERYLNLHFLKCDIANVDEHFSENEFQLIYFFNVLYAIKDKVLALKSLSKIAAPDADLVIFDYVTFNNQLLGMKDFSGNEILPLIKDPSLNAFFASTGWSLLHEINLTDKYIEWYETVLKKIKDNKDVLIEKFTLQAYDEVQNTFNTLLTKLNSNELGGYVFFCQA